MEYIAGTPRNPFAQQPPCDEFVPGYGVTTADFHVVGDHPGIHGGAASGIPFTDRPWSPAFFEVLERGGLVDAVDLDSDTVDVSRTFLSYIHMCVPDGVPERADYATMEPFFDAELRAITADVLLPVGPTATAHVLDSYTPRGGDDIDMADLHATEVQGAGWLVVPILDPAEWTADDADLLAQELRALEQSEYHRVADLGRFLPGDDPYYVR